MKYNDTAHFNLCCSLNLEIQGGETPGEQILSERLTDPVSHDDHRMTEDHIFCILLLCVPFFSLLNVY